jgi:hypothetical protein
MREGSPREDMGHKPGALQLIFNPLLGMFMMICAAVFWLAAYRLTNPGIALAAGIAGFLLGGWLDYRLIRWAGPGSSQPARLVRITVLAALAAGTVWLLLVSK